MIKEVKEIQKEIVGYQKSQFKADCLKELLQCLKIVSQYSEKPVHVIVQDKLDNLADRKGKILKAMAGIDDGVKKVMDGLK